VKIIIKNFQKKIPINPTRIKKTILKVISSEGVKKSGEIIISFVNEKTIKQLNKKHLFTNAPTDVLAFDISNPKDIKEMLGEVIISADEAVKNSKVFKTSVAHELNLYAVHGVLHIFGYDDQTLKQKALMQKTERKYVNL